MATVGKVVPQPGTPAPLSSGRAPTRSGQAADFDGALKQDVALVPRESGPFLDPHGSTEEAWTEAARQRTLEELRTLVRAIQMGVTDQFQLTDLIFYARHPELVGEPLTKDQPQLLDEWNAISALLVHPTLNEVGNILGANIIGGDFQGPEEIQWAFDRAARSPANLGKTSGDSSRFDEVISRAVQWCPGLSPTILKSMLAQESNFNPTVI